MQPVLPEERLLLLVFLGCLLSVRVVRFVPRVGWVCVVCTLTLPVLDMEVVVRVLPTFVLVEVVDLPELLFVLVMRFFELLKVVVLRFDQLAICLY